MTGCWKCDTNRPHPFHDDGTDSGQIVVSLLAPKWLNGQWEYSTAATAGPVLGGGPDRHTPARSSVPK